MQKSLFVIASIVTVIIIGCKDKPAKVTGQQIMPEMKETDSVEVIFFREPENQRWYSYVALTDKEFIKALVNDVSGPVQEENQCPKDGKIYCFKNGNIFNTIFFGYPDEKCEFLRYIKNGKLYYFPLSKELKLKLDKYKKIAKEPSAIDSSSAR